MGCATIDHLVSPDGATSEHFRAVICGGAAIKACVACGGLSTRLCDFKVRHEGVSPNGRRWHRNGTCSAPICATHTTRLPGDKDACPEHRQACLDACARLGLAVPA
jgi:hypothetical protein